MGPFIFLAPLALLALVAAASSKKKSTTATTTTTTANIPPPSPAATTNVAAAMPADIKAMVDAAINSGNPDTMRKVAAAISAKYPADAEYLVRSAAGLEPILQQWGATDLAQAQAAQAAQQALQAGQAAATATAAAGNPPAQQLQAAQIAASTTLQNAQQQAAAAPPLTQAASTSPGLPGGTLPATTTGLPPVTPAGVAQAMAAPAQAAQAAITAGTNALAAGASPQQALAAAQSAAVMAAAPAVNAIVASAATGQPPVAPMPQPPMAQPTTATTPASNVGKQLAADLAKALLTAKKGTSSEPRALVQAFQTQERLEKTDGSYGMETALALADRYGIVPPKPLYWGKKGGPPDLPQKEKASYSAHLLVLAAQDPQRADEWRAAAKV